MTLKYRINRRFYQILTGELFWYTGNIQSHTDLLKLDTIWIIIRHAAPYTLSFNLSHVGTLGNAYNSSYVTLKYRINWRFHQILTSQLFWYTGNIQSRTDLLKLDTIWIIISHTAPYTFNFTLSHVGTLRHAYNSTYVTLRNRINRRFHQIFQVNCFDILEIFNHVQVFWN